MKVCYLELTQWILHQDLFAASASEKDVHVWLNQGGHRHIGGWSSCSGYHSPDASPCSFDPLGVRTCQRIHKIVPMIHGKMVVPCNVCDWIKEFVWKVRALWCESSAYGLKSCSPSLASYNMNCLVHSHRTSTGHLLHGLYYTFDDQTLAHQFPQFYQGLRVVLLLVLDTSDTRHRGCRYSIWRRCGCWGWVQTHWMFDEVMVNRKI